MCLEKLAQRLGFVIAALGVVLAVTATIEYVPISNALAQ